jgi:hypothetical protein
LLYLVIDMQFWALQLASCAWREVPVAHFRTWTESFKASLWGDSFQGC